MQTNANEDSFKVKLEHFHMVKIILLSNYKDKKWTKL